MCISCLCVCVCMCYYACVCVFVRACAVDVAAGLLETLFGLLASSEKSVMEKK